MLVENSINFIIITMRNNKERRVWRFYSCDNCHTFSTSKNEDLTKQAKKGNAYKNLGTT